MRNYSQVSPFFWTRGTGKRLRGNKAAQILAAYLMTCPAAKMSGIFYLPAVQMEHETGLSARELREALSVLATEDYAHYDAAEELVWVPTMAMWQVGRTMSRADKRRRGVLAEVQSHIRHRFAVDFYRRYQTAYDLEGLPVSNEDSGSPFEGASGILGDPHADPIRTRTEQEPDQEQGASSPEAPPKGRRKPETPAPESHASLEVVQAWASLWGIDAQHTEFQAFLDHHRQDDTRRRDWLASWRKWLSNARKWGRSRQQTLVQSAENRAWKMPEGFE